MSLGSVRGASSARAISLDLWTQVEKTSWILTKSWSWN